MNPILQPLSFPDNSTQENVEETNNSICECLLCSDAFDLKTDGNDKLLAHLLIKHKLVIGDLKEIADFQRYISYWKGKLKDADLKTFCFVFESKNENGDIENYYMLAHELPEDHNLRERLQREKLILVLRQQQNERKNENFSRSCLFCPKTFCGNRKIVFEHMNFDHNFSVGLPDNIVFAEEFLNLLEEKLSKNICLYCERTFKDRNVLKEHMRKKQHKQINPKNKEYDKFYLINYLEKGKNWEDIMEEFDETCHDEDWSDWIEPDAEAICLFCDFQCSESEKMCLHLSSAHSFDMKSLNEDFNIIKIINYIRRQVHIWKCIFCDKLHESKKELMSHMTEQTHCKLPDDREIWDQSQYYFPTFENDALFSLLCPSEDTSDESVSHNQVVVIPEELSFDVSGLKEELIKHELIVNKSNI